MSEAKHTPGPWVVCIQDDDDKAFEIFAESQLVNGRISAEKWDDAVARAGLNHKEFEANACLIATAPDLLEALRGLDEAYCRAGTLLTREERTEDRKRLIAARAAIAKATGQPHE
ncbi:hypothetical protein N5C67_20700 [Comamonas thiooxydans]|uniref:hypothetical protein n=1 Tax=Comamonas thiooxydans TaxID=363952 RepID=UPI00244CB24C|nr:hypothetical protein [Comamonas thiooxydans]MDH1255074.1 hypothetical protein [Comamonas thiooxydans]